MEITCLCNFASVDSKEMQRLAPAPLPITHTQHPNWTGGADDLLYVYEDLTIISSDLVHFRVHQARLLKTSSNMFNGLFPSSGAQDFGEPKQDDNLKETEPRSTNDEQDHEEQKLEGDSERTLYLPESGSVLNTLFCAAYNRSPVDASHTSLSDLSLAVAALKKYGVPLETAAAERSFMFSAFASHCASSPSFALEVYVIGAAHAPDLHALAVYASQFLLSLDLSTVSDETASALGVVYLRKLIALHFERVEQFKRQLVCLPQLHKPNVYCGASGGEALLRAWSLATTYLSWAAAPDVPTSSIDRAMTSVMEMLTCDTCRVSLRNRFQNLKQEWAHVKKTI
ncbi:hypothetical protein SCHPADRAFT_898455 [Schizopora paradoxa]|uniref:Uncharacterized protein n=1 Tax=Schizopora paradoxa TaxID=27342 RepID=A0A0H2S7D9_9AGAM|nr:hypothetical protein SCHPADRAFT_898455 [Schizopora paradoxa]